MNERVKKLTGWHVLFIFLGAFAVVLGVNGYMISQAVKSYPGLEVKDSYVASQGFDDKRNAQLALGWNVAADYVDGQVEIVITDDTSAVIFPSQIQAQIGRVTTAQFDQELPLSFNDDMFTSVIELAEGQWQVVLDIVAEDGTVFKQTRVIIVP